MNKYRLRGQRGNFIVWTKDVEAISADDAVGTTTYDGIDCVLVDRILKPGEALPCPFCGKAASVIEDPGLVWVECHHCYASQQSLDGWNKRAYTEQFPVIVEEEAR